MVGGQHDQRVVGEAGLVQTMQDHANALIQ